MKIYRYRSWDGTQSEFIADPRALLDAMSELMMEGLEAQEALEWMRQFGFELAGLNMRVMGQRELIDELRREIDSLYRRYRMDEALEELQRRLEDILDREQEALRQRYGFESARMNEFLERRHRPSQRLSQRIEAMREHDFEDSQAQEDFRDLLEELESLSRLEEFLQERGQRFRGREPADYETAQEIRRRIEALEQMAGDLARGGFREISSEQLRELLGDAAADSFVLIRDMGDELRRAGFLRESAIGLTPKAIRHIGARALADVYSSLRKGVAGSHENPALGAALPRPDETRPWQFGEALDLDVVRTVMNGVRRRAAAGIAPSAAPVRLEVKDFEVCEKDYNTQTTTVLLLDMSWSMSWAGRFAAAKRVAMAMDQLIRTHFPRDHFSVVGFSTIARELTIRELPEVCWDMGDPFTNLQDGLRKAERFIRSFPSPSPQIIVITDGQPTAYFQPVRGGEQLRVEWPSGLGGISPHAVRETLGQVRRVTKQGITINTFMLDDAPELLGFVERMTQINRGRAFYTSPAKLGSFLVVDYISCRRLRRG